MNFLSYLFIILSEIVGKLSIVILSMIEHLLKKIDSLNKVGKRGTET